MFWAWAVKQNLHFVFPCCSHFMCQGPRFSQTGPSFRHNCSRSAEHLKFFETCCCSITKSCPTLCDPMDCSLLGSSLQGILQARILEWVAISFSRGSSWPGDQTHVSCIVGGCFTVWAIREVPSVFRYYKISIVIGEETEVRWPPTPGLYLPVQGLAYTLLLLLF